MDCQTTQRFLIQGWDEIGIFLFVWYIQFLQSALPADGISIHERSRLLHHLATEKLKKFDTCLVRVSISESLSLPRDSRIRGIRYMSWNDRRLKARWRKDRRRRRAAAASLQRTLRRRTQLRLRLGLVSGGWSGDGYSHTFAWSGQRRRVGNRQPLPDLLDRLLLLE